MLEREAFIEWHTKTYGYCPDFVKGKFNSDVVQQRWVTWQAAIVWNDELFSTEAAAYFAAGQKYMAEIARLTSAFNDVVKKSTSLQDKIPEVNSGD